MNRRRRSLAAVAGAGLLASTLGGFTAANHAAVSAAPGAPAGDCAVAFPVAGLESGDEVSGLTVAKGTTPAPFTGEVLGVLKDGIAPGMDMIIADLTSPDIDRVGSIWAGMSGSPVYAADGRLIGAVSYGLAWGPSPVAGITPYEHMDDLLGSRAPSQRVALSGSDAKAVAKAAGVTQTQAARGMKRLSVPMTASGIDPARVAAVAERSWFRSPQAGGTAVDGVGAETVVAGGNLGASVAHGVVTYSGVGTATSVCKGGVVGFGHPLAYMGSTTMSLHPAQAVYVQEDPAGVAVKHANLGAPVGTITHDRWAGISGVFGPEPEGTVVSSTSRFGNRSFTGSTTVTEPAYAPEVSWLHIASTNDRALDASVKGNALVTWSVKGTDEKGAPFTLQRTDRHPGSWDLASEAVGDGPDILWALQRMSGVEVDSLDADVSLSESTARLRVKGLERRVNGKWVKVRGPVVAKAGKKLALRAVLVSNKKTEKRKVTVVVPKRLKGTAQRAWVAGGLRYWESLRADSVADLKKSLAKGVRNDQVVLVLGDDDKGRAAPQAVSPTASTIVVGQKRLRVIVR